MTFGQIGVTWNSGGTPSPVIQQLNQTQSITILVNAVAGKNVTATQTYNYKNGTSQSSILTGNVQTGQGNLSIWILAGGLSAGDSLTQSPSGFLGPIGQTVSRVYVGAVRPVNELVENYSFFGPETLYVAASWDQSTGFLVELTEVVSTSYPVQSYSIHAKVTATNAWSPSAAPDFALDATPQSRPFIYLGQSAKFNLNLTGVNGFNSPVSLSPSLLNSSLANPPILSLTQSSVQVSPGGSTPDTLTFSTSSTTPLGLYLFSVTGASGNSNHAATFAIYVIPPNFEIFATPSNPTVAAGAATTSTITVEALGAFYGTVGLATSSDSQLVQASLDRNSAILSSTTAMVNSTLTVSASSYVLPGSHAVSIVASSGNLQHTVNIPVTVTGPDFQILTNSSLLTIAPGSSGMTTIILRSSNGFSGTVSLSGSAEGGLSLAFSPVNIPLSTGSGQSTATISVPANTSPGYYYVIVTGVGGVLSHSTYVSVTVNGPDFSIIANPSVLTILPGKNATSILTLTSLNNFGGSIVLAASTFGFGSGFGYAFSSTNVNLSPGGTASVTLTVSIPSTVTPFYPSIDVYAVSGNMSSQAYIPIVIPGPPPGPPPPPTAFYDISANPNSMTIPRGGRANSTITLTSYNGFVGTLSLSVSVQGGLTGTCPGANCPAVSLSRTRPTLSSGGTNSSLLSIMVPSTAPGGSYQAVVSSTYGFVTTSIWVSFQIPAPDFAVLANTQSVSLPDGGGSATPTIIVTSIDNFTGTISLTRSIQGPTGVCPGPNCPSATLNPSSLALPVSGLVASQLTLTTTASTPPGIYSVIVNATSGPIYHTTTIYLTVGSKDFSFSASPSALIIRPGYSGIVTVSLGSLNGFSGNVTISALPGTPLTVMPQSKNLTLASGGVATGQFTILAASSLPPGNYYLGLQANRTHIHEVFVSVIVAAPDFSMIPNPSQLTVLTAGIANATITLLSLDGQRGTVSLNGLSVSGPGCPGTSCPSASLSKSSISLAPGGWGYSNLTVSAPSNAALGYYTISLTGTNGTLTHTAPIPLYVVSHTSTSISCASPVLAGTQSTCTTTVTNTSTNAAAPSGTVALTSNSMGAFSGPCLLSAISSTSASCTVSYTPTIGGSHTISANYGGDSSHGSSSGQASVTATKRNSSTSISCTPSVLAGQASTCVAAVTDTSGAGAITPTGSVTFSETGASGSFSVSSCTLSGIGASASCSAVFTPSVAGNALVSASYSGGPAHNGSSSPSSASIASTKRTSTLSISCNSPLSINQASTCTATVIDNSSLGTAITPTGIVTLSSTGAGSLSAPSCTLTAGSCTVSFTGTAIETATVNGTYAGDLAHTGSVSTAASISITTAQPDFSLNTSPSSLSITQGSSSSTTITLTSQNGFGGAVALSANSPNGITVGFSQSSISGSQSSTMTVTVSGSVAAGSYTITITGTSGSLSHQKTMSITVNSSQAQTSQPILGLPTFTFYVLVGAIVVGAGVASWAVMRRRHMKSHPRISGPKPQ